MKKKLLGGSSQSLNLIIFGGRFGRSVASKGKTGRKVEVLARFGTGGGKSERVPWSQKKLVVKAAASSRESSNPKEGEKREEKKSLLPPETKFRVVHSNTKKGHNTGIIAVWRGAGVSPNWRYEMKNMVEFYFQEKGVNHRSPPGEVVGSTCAKERMTLCAFWKGLMGKEDLVCR